MSREVMFCVAGLVAGLLIGWYLWRPAEAPIEAHAPEIRLPSGGLVLEREPEAQIPQPVVAAVKELGRGAKLERAVKVTVKPKPKVTDAVPCPPVTLDLGLVKMPDDTRRVIATSPDGEIIGGVDIPIDAAVRVKQLKWAAGGLYNPLERSYGVFLDRDVGPFRVGVDVMDSRVDGVTAMARVGIRF